MIPIFLNISVNEKKKLYECACYNELRVFVLSVGFMNSLFNASLFIYNHDGIIFYFFLYM